VAEPFTHSFRVLYAECDVQGVVFNSHYLAFVDIVITELWREAFGGYAVMLDRGIDVVVAEAHLHFHRPARFDDTVTVAATITHLGTTSIISDTNCSATARRWSRRRSATSWSTASRWPRRRSPNRPARGWPPGRCPPS
jgi:YbgC/YbaW family acyl-CoA thioester hydrolase